LVLAACLGLPWLAGYPAVDARAADTIEFNRDIRPILSDNCFQCHGPDSAQRKADLRLDVEASAMRDVEGVRPIVPGELDQGELYRRIATASSEERMPPVDSGKKLSAEQIELIGRWIRGGAQWEKHWAFLPVKRPSPPAVTKADWVQGPIDAFVLARLEAAGLTPADAADRTTLLRRVTLDLTGLPPTTGAIEAYLADHSPDAYSRVVDRLLASPRYGERMASTWLDAARYADTSGYQTDGIRHMWRWRDWVIEAFNRNLPFDQFTIAQIAGDMLEGATLDDRIATGFNRNHRGNAEGGIIPEEYAVEYVVDRVDTTATVWLGLTMACTRCHDHKFDPITQREFYEFYAFFNNVPERGRAVKVGNSPPMIQAPTRDQLRQLAAIDAELAAANEAYAKLSGEITSGEAAWIASFAPSTSPHNCAPENGLVAHYSFDADQPARAGVAHELQGEVSRVPGAICQAAAFSGSVSVSAGNVADFGYFDKFTFSAWIYPERDTGTVLARMTEGADAEGYSVQLDGGKLQVNLVKRWLDDALRVETVESLATNRWQHIAVTYDGSRVAAGVQILVDGRPLEIKVLLDELNQSFATNKPLVIGGGGPGAGFQGQIDDVRVYATNLSADDALLLATHDTIDAIVAISSAARTPGQVAKLRHYYLSEHAPEPIRAARQKIIELAKRRTEFEERFPSTMVMEELPQRRETFILARGQYDKPGEQVAPAVPASLHPLPSAAARDRLSLARWLVDPANPLVARVTVNRFWQMYFGAGLVKTVDDFGAQGDPPSHPQLLDWLASDFVASGWDMKALVRKIVTSATYRQSSKVRATLMERDPENRLLARGPRLRLSAEAIRDQSLAVGGLLVERTGGPSVHPYQPPGLWKELTGGGDVAQDHGADLYRRSLYTFWKRTIAPPSMVTFDAAGREACSVRAARTNTPLQALALLNEITFVEAARMLAQRAMLEGGATPAERIALVFRLALARAPSESERAVLLSGYERQLAFFKSQPAAAAKLLAVGESPADPRCDTSELAALATVSSLVLNLDEVVTKE
jgi:mono/diheme cytochrome c family protein